MSVPVHLRAGGFAALLLLLGIIPAPAVASGPPARELADPRVASSDWLRRASARIASDEYQPSTGALGLQAPNRAHNLRTRFLADRVELGPRDANGSPAWRFAWRLTGWGRAGEWYAESPAESGPRCAGARVTYDREGLSEWYENGAAGLEQGFTVSRRPTGDGPLIVAGVWTSTLRASPRDDGRAIAFLDPAGSEVLRYGGLCVRDVSGRELPSRLGMVADRLVLSVEDAGAEYPLAVDPVITSPAWRANGDQATAMLGTSVSTAGDVNADGYSDVIVGVPDFDNGEANEGRAYLYLGSASGLGATAAWTAEGNQVSALFGQSVGTAGDVNGDGYSDVIVGVPYYDFGQTDEGRAYVYLGSASGLNANPVWSAESDQASAHFGFAVATAGDVNGDGYADVIIAARDYDNGQTDEGRAYVFLGSAAGPAASASWTAESDQANAQLGFAVSTAGDVNCDGYADVIVGSRNYTSGQSNEGRAWLFFGAAGGLATTAIWTGEGNLVGAQFGYAVGNAGDVNGDGYGDIIVGAPGYDDGQTDEGRAFVYFGTATGISAGSGWAAESNQASAYFGCAVGTAGDVNGDGYADVIIGAYAYDGSFADEGGAFVYEGGPTGPAANAAWQTTPGQAGAWLGYSVGTAGDVNGDGYSDVIAGAPHFDDGQTDEGRALVYLGTAAGPDTTSRWSYVGSATLGDVGNALAPAGDVNGDGYSDVMLGAQIGSGPGATRVHVFYGSRTGYSASPSWTCSANAQDSVVTGFGTAGDVNGDGYSDLLVSIDGGLSVFYGSATGLAASPGWTVPCDQPADRRLNASTSAGDVNGDGYGDVIVGNRYSVNANGSSGRAYIYMGSATGLAATPAWLVMGGLVDGVHDCNYFGTAVGAAGDVNGDGFSDVVVTAPSQGDLYGSGMAFVFYGSHLAPSTSPNWSAAGDNYDQAYGQVACTAGDVNGDGYSDVVITDPWYTAASHRGRVWVYHGSPSGLGSTAANLYEGAGTSAWLGWSASTAGDVNGDGYSDLVVSAPEQGDPDNIASQGFAFVYLGSSSGLGSSPDWSYQDHGSRSDFGYIVISPGDANGDGFSDVMATSPYYGSSIGRVDFLPGNDGLGLDRAPRQARADDVTPIALLGTSDSETGFRLKALGRTAAGRDKVRLQCEVKPFGTDFNALALGTGSWFDTGARTAGGSRVALSVPATGLTSNHRYHWRLRVRGASPYFPSTPWFVPQGNGTNELDLRTARSWVGVDGAPAPHAGAWLAGAAPNPFAVGTRIAYTLPQPGRVRLEVYACSGRRVAVLADGVAGAGEHVAQWNGSGAGGQPLGAGVYFVRLEFAGRSEARKLVLLR